MHSSTGQHDTIPIDTIPIDSAPHYVLGKDEGACDIVLRDGSCSREHAALVHHQDGRLFLIDLGSVSATPASLALPHSGGSGHAPSGMSLAPRWTI